MEKSKVDIALVIIHESIHAYLNVKFRSPTIGMSIANINNMDIANCINTYYNGFSGNQTQHSFFVDYMIPTITEILTDIKDSLVTPQEATEAEYPTNGGSIIYEPLTTNPPSNEISDVQVQWNWITFFYYFSFTGLQNCSAFPFNFPFQTLNDYYYIRYMSAFNFIFNP
ncbi:MAG TPA: hypothetical protein VK164_06880 [Flavobacterium sp.]|uniref:hypothetical protein n=1 Tax=Flavobacterium sp. TaxID=239 RepID=UPI002B4B2FDE|nr:hypothetical protein [Flavobacterium sp.]HLO73642.1 hypothetical protein [Flavobacterium sp.]